jgi:hypothetical protein
MFHQETEVGSTIIHSYMFILMYVHMYSYLYMYICIHTYVCTYVFILMYAHMYSYLYMHIFQPGIKEGERISNSSAVQWSDVIKAVERKVARRANTAFFEATALWHIRELYCIPKWVSNKGWLRTIQDSAYNTCIYVYIYIHIYIYIYIYMYT